MSKKKADQKKLGLKKETLRQISNDDLGQVAGGLIPKGGYNCTGRLSGCISMC